MYAAKYVMLTYNIKRASLEQASKITPGMKAPTVTPLEDAEWVAVNVMVPKKEVHDKMDELEVTLRGIVCNGCVVGKSA